MAVISLDVNAIKEIGEQLELEGSELRAFIIEQQEKIREDRTRERSLERQRLLAAQAASQHIAAPTPERTESIGPRVKLPPFKDQDDLTAYLTRFDRVAALCRWEDDTKALQLGSLLEGRALTIYAGLSEQTICSYALLREALLGAFRLTEEHYRKDFRFTRIGPSGSFRQLATDLSVKLDNWTRAAKVPETYESLRSFVLIDQFFSSLPPEVRLFLREQNIEGKSLEAISSMADQYATAHPNVGRTPNNRSNPSRTTKPHQGSNQSNKAPPGNKEFATIRCFSCGEAGHKRPACPKNPRASTAKVHRVYALSENQRDLGPMYNGTVNGSSVSTILRDTGCSCVVVSEQLVPDYDVGNARVCEVADFLGRKSKFPVVPCYIKCDLFEGWVDAVRAPLKYCAVLLGNIDGVKPFTSSERETASLPPTEPASVQAVTRAAIKRAVHPLVLPDIEPLKVSKGEFVKLQQSCDTLADVRDKVSHHETYVSRSQREYIFVIENELLYRKCIKSPKECEVGKFTLVVPFACRKLVLKLAHDLPVSGHFSHRRTEMKVLDKFWWPGVSGEIVRYCRSCDACQRTAARGRTRPVAMAQMPIISIPFERVAVDLVGPLKPASRAGNKHILTLLDYATSFIEAVPLKEITSISIAEALMAIFARVGIPREIISDRGTQFTSELMGHVHSLVGIKPIFTTPYHPMMNGKIERQHAVLKSVLKKLCAEKPTDWDRYLVPTLFALREIPSETTGYSPFELLYGRQVRGPLSILHDLWSEPDLNSEQRTSYEYVIQLRDRLEIAAEHAATSAKLKSDSYKKYFDKKSVQRTFEVGEEVLLLLPDNSSKLLMAWKGPYKVLEVRSKLNYVIDVSGTPKLFHVNLLKRYVRRATIGCFYVADEETTLSYFGLADENEVVQSCVIQDDESQVTTVPGKSGDTAVDINPELTGPQKQALLQILDKHSKTLSDMPGCTNALEHRIVLKTTEVTCRKSYPVPVHLKEVFDKEVDRLLQMDIIGPSTSDFCSPSVLVEKSGTPSPTDDPGPDSKSFRLTNDFRAVNSITQFDAEPMPSIEADLHKFAGANYLSEIDITRAYYQIKLEENSRKYTAFATSKGLMEYKRLPFGLSTACATYTRLMRRVMNDLPGDSEKYVSVYFDNIYVATGTFNHHLEILDLVFTRLSNFGLTARPSKCHLAYPTVQYLGFRVGKGELSPTPDNTDAIKTMSVPKTKKQLRSFLGLVSFYRMFISGLANLTAPLSDMLKKTAKEPLEWTDTTLAKLNELKERLISPPLLKVPDLTKKFCLRVDASNVGLGAVLLQYWDNVPQPVFYASRKLLPREANYSAIEKECLALVWAVEKFQYYLYGREFLIETDHRPLVYMKNFKGKNARLTRWALSLQPYTFTIVHIPGTENHGADLLSRCFSS